MANEEIYEAIAKDLATAKEQLEKAKDLREFAKDAGLPLAVSDAEIQSLEERITKFEGALAKRGLVVP